MCIRDRAHRVEYLLTGSFEPTLSTLHDSEPARREAEIADIRAEQNEN